MINETTRIVRRWLEHPEHGVLAQLAAPGFPHQNAAGEDDDMPADPTIYDDVDNAEDVKNLNPPVVPALIVFADSNVRIDSDQRNYQVTETPLGEYD